MTESLRPLPILQPGGGIPAGKALATLRQAKAASGYSGLILPSEAVEGSPEPILAVGTHPSWLTRYAYVPDWTNANRLTNALIAILLHPEDERMFDRVDLLSSWFKADVKYVGEEEYHGGPSFN